VLFRSIDWIRDAHGMEMQAAKLLESQIGRVESYPELRAKFKEHLEVTRRQAERLEGCLKRHGEDTSMVKDTMGKMAGVMQTFGGLFPSDEVVKTGIASYTFENMEISSYSVLIGAAEHFGDTETARICTDILREEEEMASWLKNNIPNVTQQFLTRAEVGTPAKR
jgi:ferritin-like metal-binding protein YciE